MDPKLNKAAEEGDVMYLATRIVRIKRKEEEELTLGILRINGTEEEENQYGQSEDLRLLKTTQEGRNNILHLAAKAGHDLFVALALQFLPALSNQLNSQGETPLLVAAKFGHLNVAGTINKPKIKFQIRRDVAAFTTTLIGTYSSGSSRHVEEAGLVDIPLELGTIHDDKAIGYSPHHLFDEEERIRSGLRRQIYSAELYKAAKKGDVSCLSGIAGRNITEDVAVGIEDGKFVKRTCGDNNILHIAARAGHKTFVVESLKRFPFLSDQVNREGDTPLVVAARFGHLEVVKALAEPANEAKMQDDRATAVENETNSSIHQRKEEEGPIDNQLEHASSDVLIPRPCRFKNLKQDTTALHEALRNGHESVASYLLYLDPAILSLVNGAGESPIYLAAESNCQMFITDVLLGRCGFSAEGPEGQNILHVARDCEYNIFECLGLWRKDLNLMRKLDNRGKAPIHLAVEADHKAWFDHMLKVDATLVLLRDSEGYTPLLRASSRGCWNMCKEMLQKCPEAIEKHNNKGQNALHLAKAKVGAYPSEIMELVNVGDDEGNTPLHLAVKENQYGKAISLISLASIDLGAVNKGGLTALDLCESDCQHITTKRLMWYLLRRLGAPRGRHPNRDQLPVGGPKGVIRSRDEDTKPIINALAVVAALLATLTFTAAFTMPGGYDSSPDNLGASTLAKKAALKVFILSDTLAMCCSILALFLLLHAMRVEQDVAVPLRNTSRSLVFFSLYATLVAFMSGIFAVIAPNALWVAILVCAICSVAPFLFLPSRVQKFSYLLPIILINDFRWIRQQNAQRTKSKWVRRSSDDFFRDFKTPYSSV